MDPIQEISEVNVRVEETPSWVTTPPAVPNTYVPVTIKLGFPIVNMPGCVEAHPDNKTQIGPNGLPLDRNLVNDDEAGVKILCPDGQFPSYNPINFEPEQVIPTVAASPPPVAPPPPEIPDTGNIVTDEETPCPGPSQLRVGDVTQSGDERVVGHRLLEDGKTCETLYEPTTPVEKFLPSVNQTTTTVAIAVVATAGAAATPLLIRVIKPIVKKLWTTLQKKLGKGKKKEELTSDKILEKNGMKKLKITD